MLRAIIVFAVFTITAAAPAPTQDAGIELNDVRNNIDKSPLLHEHSKNNEISQNNPVGGYIDFETSSEGDDANDIGQESRDINSNSVGKKSVKQPHRFHDHDEDIKENLIDVDDNTSEEYKGSPFITLLIEFVKSIAEQIMKAYRS